MKKLMLIPLFVASTAFAALTGSVTELNAEILKLLAPFQNEATTAQLAFSKAETDTDRALSLAVSALYKKVGTQNLLEINAKNISYEYGDGSAPTTNVDASLGIDLTKLMPQEQINEIIPNVEEMIRDASAGYLAQYGEAVTVETKITEKTQDEAGNYVGIKGAVSFNIDLTKLPAEISLEDVVVKSGSANISVNVKTGLSLTAVVVSNPAYKGFQDENEGLKEMLDKFLSKDQDTLNQVLELFRSLDSFADGFVNGQQ